LTMAFMTPFAHLDSRGAQADLRRVFLVGTRMCALVAAVVIACLVGFGGSFIRLWIGEAYVSGALSHRSDVVLIALALAYTPRALQGVSWQLILASKRVGYLSAVVGIESVVKLLLSMILARRYGLLGIAMGSLVPMWITGLIFVPRRALSVSGVSAREYIVEGVARPIVVGFAVFMVTRAVTAMLPPTSWSGLFGDAGLVAVLVVVFAVYIGIKAEERQALVRQIRSLTLATA